MRISYRHRKVAVLLLAVFLTASFFLPSISRAEDTEDVLKNPLAGFEAKIVSPEKLYGGKIIRTLIGLAGVIALALFVVSGSIWLTSAGNPEKVKSAKQIMVWTVIGLGVIFGSYVFLRALIGVLPKQTPSLPAGLPVTPGEPGGLPPPPGFTEPTSTPVPQPLRPQTCPGACVPFCDPRLGIPLGSLGCPPPTICCRSRF